MLQEKIRSVKTLKERFKDEKTGKKQCILGWKG